MGASSRPTRRPGCCATLGKLQFAHPRRIAVAATATALLTLLGATGESLGMDRLLKSNTSKTRTHSLFRQGCMLYDLIPTMPEHRLAPLMARFGQAVAQCSTFSRLFAAT